MNRAARLQDRRMLKFRDLWEAGELSMMAAGELLGISGVRLGAVDCVDRTEIVTPPCSLL
jgi:hypothetical protein